MGYSSILYRIIKPQISDIKSLDFNTWKLDSKTKKRLLEFGLRDKMIKIAGNYFIGIEEIEDGSFHRRYDQQYYEDYWNKEIHDPSMPFDWDVIVNKSRLEEICDKYISEQWLKDYFRDCIINKHIDGQTIVLRI